MPPARSSDDEMPRDKEQTMTATGGPSVAAPGTVRPPRRRYPRRSAWAALVLVVVLVGAGCGSTAPPSTPAPTSTPGTGFEQRAELGESLGCLDHRQAADGTRRREGPGRVPGGDRRGMDGERHLDRHVRDDRRARTLPRHPPITPASAV